MLLGRWQGLPAEDVEQGFEQPVAVHVEPHWFEAQGDRLTGPVHVQRGQGADNVLPILYVSNVLQHWCDLCQATSADTQIILHCDALHSSFYTVVLRNILCVHIKHPHLPVS